MNVMKANLFFTKCLFVLGCVLADVNNGVSLTTESYHNEDDNTNKFVPTSEWQTIPPGKGIPRGLHVRMNLETGHKEAKLMSNDNDSPIVMSDQNLNVKIVKDVKNALRKIPDDSGQFNPPRTNQKFKTMEEIKKDFDAINVQFRTETEILTQLMNELKMSDLSPERLNTVLNDIEYYVHQYDNAQDFIKMGGLQLTMPLLNSSYEDVRSSAAFLLGSAMQSNPSVQVSAADSGLLQKLLSRLVVDSSFLVQNKVLYALSCLIRRFPYAQQKFLELGGLTVVTGLFDKESELAEKLKLKTVTMLYDLILEQKFALENVQVGNNLDEEKRRQYEKIEMKQAVAEAGWCLRIPHLLLVNSVDVHEKVLNLMTLIADSCGTTFVQWLPKLKTLHDYYLRKFVDDEDYFMQLKETISALVKILEGITRDEL